jgi:SAM-dependent methyltransferase
LVRWTGDEALDKVVERAQVGVTPVSGRRGKLFNMTSTNSSSAFFVHRKGTCLVQVLCSLILVSAPLVAQQEGVQRDVPYVPSPTEIVETMLKLGEVKQGDILYDLGCGDGRIVITAAQKFGARGTGVDIDPERIQEAEANARQAGVSDRVRFIQKNLFDADIHDATVVTLYLLPDVNLKLRPKLLRDLKVGTRIVSHQFDMGDWKPDKQVDVGWRSVYLWTVTEKAKRDFGGK